MPNIKLTRIVFLCGCLFEGLLIGCSSRTDPDSATLCRECHIDGPVFCCPENEPCMIKQPAPKVQLRTPRVTTRGLWTNNYFTR